MKRVNDGSLTVLIPSGDINGEAIPDLENSLNSVIQDNQHKIALNMEKVDLIFSRGIGVLMKTQKALKNNNGGLYLYNINDSIQRIFLQSNLTSYLHCFSSKEEIDFELLSPTSEEDDLSLELGLSIETVTDKLPTFQIKLGGTMDSEADVQNLRQVTQDAILKGFREIIFEMTDLVYLDDVSAMEIINFSKQINDFKGTLLLQHANEIILEQLQTMGSPGYFTIP